MEKLPHRYSIFEIFDRKKDVKIRSAQVGSAAIFRNI